MVKSVYEQLPLSSSFDIVLEEDPPALFTPQELEEAEVLWEKLLKEKPLFNGKILNCLALDSRQMVGCYVDYKLFLAQQRLPALRERLSPVAISGISCAGEQLLVGKRASFLATHPGLYELVPSGGIDESASDGMRVDFKKQYHLELSEEAGLLPEKITPLFIARDGENNILEICCLLTLDSSYAGKELSPPTDEYEQLFWLGRQQLEEHIAENRSRYVPLSLLLAEIFMQG